MKMKPPMSLHEDLVSNFFTRDAQSGAIVGDDAITALAGGLKSAREAAEQICAVANACAADLTGTVSAGEAKTRRIALQLGEHAGKALDAAKAAAMQEVAELEFAMMPEMPADESALQIEGEIRNRLAAMSHDDRAKLIAAAINSGDDRTIAAIARGPGWLCGLGDEEHAMRLSQWRAKTFPRETDRAARIRRAIEATDIGGKALLAFVKNIADSPGAVVAEAAAARAAEAIAAAEARATVAA